MTDQVSLHSMVDVATIISYLSALSSIAVVLGAIFVVFQLRQNARLIKTANFETKSNMSFSVLEKITEESFARRRKNMHDAVKKYSQINWEGFDDSLEDFEARNFGYIYELIGELVKEGIIDQTIAVHSLRYLVVSDWDRFQPLVKHLMERFKVSVNPYSNFEWLASETRKFLQDPGTFHAES
ncbi:DUF4760 domain-containing protein [Candidatus Bathyarchaeota archaeon]|nr:DUF4760 domain-containing protein [Candidatus Bathyarchaeota archaeon]